MSLIATTALFGLKKSASPIITALLKNWQALAGVMLIVLVFYQNTFDTRRFFWVDTIPYWKNIANENENTILDLVADNEKLREGIDMRNDQIDEWKDVSIEEERKKAKLQQKLDTQDAILRVQIREILSKPTPQTCEASINFLRDHIPDLQYGPRKKPQ